MASASQYRCYKGTCQVNHSQTCLQTGVPKTRQLMQKAAGEGFRPWRAIEFSGTSRFFAASRSICVFNFRGTMDWKTGPCRANNNDSRAVAILLESNYRGDRNLLAPIQGAPDSSETYR